MKWSWLYFPGIVLLITFAVNIRLIYLANSGNSQLLEDHPYERGLNFEETLASEREFNRDGYILIASFIRSSQSELGTLSVKLNRESSPADISDISIKAIFLAEQTEDKELALSPIPNLSGEFSSMPIFRSGAWRIQFYIKTDGKAFTLTRQLNFLNG